MNLCFEYVKTYEIGWELGCSQCFEMLKRIFLNVFFSRYFHSLERWERDSSKCYQNKRNYTTQK